MNVKTLDEIMDGLQKLRPEVVAAETGLGITTIYKFRGGRTQNPSHETVVKLSEYLTAKGGE